MRLMVTGGAGFIGSAVVRLAIARGHAVLNVDALTYAANRENLATVEAHPDYTFLEADIADRDRIADAMAEFRPDAVLHLAAESHVDRSIDGPARFIMTNVVGTFSLLETARDYLESGRAPERFRFLHVSTDEVFGSLGPTGAFTEASPHRPNSPYAASKAASDMLVRAWGETYGLPVLISNCSNNYGPFQFPEKLIPVVIDAARHHRPIPVYGAGDQVRDWLHVDDHADALLLIAGRGVPGETYAVGGRAERSNLDLVRTLCAILDARLPDRPAGGHAALMTHVADRPGHDQRYAIDCSKIERALGWRAMTPLETGLARTVDWYLANPGWVERIRARGHGTGRLGLAHRAGRAPGAPPPSAPQTSERLPSERLP